MSKDRGKNPPPKSGKKPAPPPRRQTTEIQPISPLGLVGAIMAALVIAAILLFAINTRINAARPAAPTATPIVAPRPATATPVPAAPTGSSAPGATQPPQATAPGVTLTGGFAKGNAQAKVTLTEFGDFK